MEYKTGSTNRAADALSRQQEGEEDGTMVLNQLHVSGMKVTLLQQLKEAALEDEGGS